MANRSGYLDRDAADQLIQQGVSWSITDSSGSPKTSPQAVATATASACALVTPAPCLGVWLNPDQTMYAAPDASATSAHGVKLIAGIWQYFPSKAGATLSINAAPSAGNLSFYFVKLNDKTCWQASADQ